MKALQAREWAGNVRELENVVERAVISARARCSTSATILDDGQPVANGGRRTRGRRTLAQAERDHMTATLERLNWRIEVTGARPTRSGSTRARCAAACASSASGGPAAAGRNRVAGGGGES